MPHWSLGEIVKMLDSEKNACTCTDVSTCCTNRRTYLHTYVHSHKGTHSRNVHRRMHIPMHAYSTCTVTPGQTLGTLYTFGVGSIKTKQHTL